MKYLKYFLVAGLISIATSSYTTRTSGLSVGIDPGNLIPNFSISDDAGNDLKLSDLKGQKVLVSLWAAYDADSHMKNVLLWNFLNKGEQDLKMVSISFDKSESVFKKTLTADGIDNNSQFLDAKGDRSDIYQRCRLEKGFNNYLLDENGVIIAKNVMPQDLKELLN